MIEEILDLGVQMNKNKINYVYFRFRKIKKIREKISK
jgi:hypothetical protein